NDGHRFVARTPDGWHAEPIPGTTPAESPAALLARSSDSAFAFFLRGDVASQQTVLELFERKGTGWQAGVPVASWPPGSFVGDMSFAISADGARLAFVDNSSAPALHLRDAGGWREFSLAPDHFLTCGFNPGGKAWVLGALHGCGAEQDFVLYEEP